MLAETVSQTAFFESECWRFWWDAWWQQGQYRCETMEGSYSVPWIQRKWSPDQLVLEGMTIFLSSWI
jgi:hypothetical protein